MISKNCFDTILRGLFRNFDLRVLLLNTELTLERVPLSKSQKFTGSAEPVEPVLKRPLILTMWCGPFLYEFISKYNSVLDFGVCLLFTIFFRIIPQGTAFVNYES